jgi:AcrR family transcriptional regulator
MGMDNVKSATTLPLAHQDDASDTKKRRRGDSLEADILQAAWEELAAVGYAHLTMEGVANRAKTSKAVVYRRWRNRPELVLAAMLHHRPVLGREVPDSGSLRGDLLALLRRAAQRLEEVGAETIHGLMTEYFNTDPVAMYLQSRSSLPDSMATILERATERGEIDPAKVTPRIASLPMDLVRHEVLLTHTPIPDEAIVEIVDEIFLPLVRP